jgi:hypothetical protein
MLYFSLIILQVILVFMTILFMMIYSPYKFLNFAGLPLKVKILPTPLIKENVDFVLYQLIRIIYNKIKIFNQPATPKFFLFIAFFVYCSLEGISLNIAMLFSYFFYYLAFFVYLVNITYNWINNTSFRDNFPLLHSIIFYLLVSLLVYDIYLFILNLLFLCHLIFTLLKSYILKSNFLSKLKDFKLSLEYKYYKHKNPKGPKPLRFFTTSEKRDKRRILELKEKLFNNLNPCNDTSAAVLDSKEISFSQRRNWKETINIGERVDLSNSDLLRKIEFELKAYDINEKKFKQIVVNICKGKEDFYPNDSISEFNESVKVIKILMSNLESSLKTIENNLKK